MSIKDDIARGLRDDGMIVIRADAQGAPHLIAFRSDLAEHIKVLTITTNPGPLQKAAIDSLKAQGVKAEIMIPEESPFVKPTHEQVLMFEEEWHKAGFIAFGTDADREDYPQSYPKWSARWYRQRNAWQAGWDGAQKLLRRLPKRQY